MRQLRCQQCAIELPLPCLDNRCGQCLSKQPAFDHSYVVCNYEPPFDQLVTRLKFSNQLPIAHLFAQTISENLLLHTKTIDLPDYLCPVPLSKERLSERGFNQSLEIAKPLSNQLGISLIPNLIIRVKNTLPQSQLSLSLREKNMKNAFIIHPQWITEIEGKHIGIVDDVITTGATIQEISLLLKRFGASSVSNFVFARTPLKHN